MGLLHFVVTTVGKCLDAVCLLLDINFLIVHTVVRSVVAVVSFIHSLPSLLLLAALQLGDLLLSGAASAAEAASGLLHGAATVLGTLPVAAEGLLESLKMVGYLSLHVLLRGKEHLCRGVLSVADGCSLTAGLLLSSFQSAVNFALLAAFNVYVAALSVWQMVSSPLQKVLELTLTFLCSLAAVLWAPCQLLLSFSTSLLHVLVSVFVLNVYGLLLTLAVALTTTAYLNPRLSRQAAARLAEYLRSLPGVAGAGVSLRRARSSALVALRRARSSARLLRRTLRRLYLLERGLWQQLSRHISQLGLLLRTHRHGPGDGRARGDGDPGEERRDPPDGRAGDGLHREQLLDSLLPSSSTARPLKRQPSPGNDAKQLPAENLLTLLKEQEERKKCVICQDCAKTVVLLPCRHLCLCRDCTRILLGQPIYLQNCPLCRHMILNTMDVYL